MQGGSEPAASGAASTPGTHLRGALPLGLVLIAIVLMYVALKHWHRTRTAPKPLRNHRKLLAEAAKATPGVSRRQMQALGGLANTAGLSSPLVAMICPSAINRLAGQIREEKQRQALRTLAESLVRAQRRQAGSVR